MKISSNRCNQAFSQEVDNCQNWLCGRLFAACGHSSGVLLDRLVQLVADMGHYPYALAVTKLNNSGSNCFPLQGTKIDCSRLFMEIGSGRVTVTLKQWIVNQLQFVLHWGYCFIAILAVKNTDSKKLSATLVFGVGKENLFYDGNDERFISFCRLGPIAPLRNGKRLIIQYYGKKIFSSQPTCIYSRNPLITLLREANMGYVGRCRLIINHIILFFAYTFATIRVPQLSLIGKEFPYGNIASELDRREFIDAIVITCSAYKSQPLWLRGLTKSQVHMVWYAQNWLPLAYSFDNVVADLPQLRWIKTDIHWVWTHAFARYLKMLGHDKAIEVVGPIVWYLPQLLNPVRDAIEIIIFDTPALTDEAMLRDGGEVSNYYYYDNLRAFIQDVTSLKLVIEKTFCLPVFLRLKTKRDYRSVYDKRYYDYIKMQSTLEVFVLEPLSVNIYECVSRSHLAIAYPFSSAGYIAEAIGTPAIFYDPTRSVLRQDFCDSDSSIGFANCREDLVRDVISVLSVNFPIVTRDLGSVHNKLLPGRSRP
jgi:hypothetical protein